jgi:hypothetical protein
MFCDIDDFCKVFEPFYTQRLLQNGQRQRVRQRVSKSWRSSRQRFSWCAKILSSCLWTISHPPATIHTKKH